MSPSRSVAAHWWKAPAAPYVAAVAIRTAARAAWGLALPTALSVAAYGRYQVLVTAAAMGAQLALLGIPQTIVRHTGRRLPVRVLTFHAGALAVVAVAAAAAFIPAMRSAVMVIPLAGLVLATIAATALGARAKARFAFGTSLRAESAGAAVLLLVALAAAAGWWPTSVAWRPFGGRHALGPTAAVVTESIALAMTAMVLLGARAASGSGDGASRQASPSARAVLGDVYAVGALVMLDVVLFRRLEVYFLERSPDGLAGVAVLGLSLQIAAVAMLLPTALLEAWQPRLSLVRSSGGDAAFAREVARRGKQFGLLMLGVVALGTLVPVVAVPILFPHYRPWLGYVTAFVFVRLVCAGAGFYSAALYAVGQHRVLYAPSVAAAVVAVGANALLTLPMGLRGALVAYGVTQVTVALLTVAAFHRSSARRRLDAAPADRESGIGNRESAGARVSAQMGIGA